MHTVSVVICLKTRTFAVSQTTLAAFHCLERLLWFAWKLVLLQYRKQLTLLSMPNVLCCDLLENSYFCSIANNQIEVVKSLLPVVICLKTRTFAVSQTTACGQYKRTYKLWFAWKLVLLQYRKQLPVCRHNRIGCCDLLENSYFCSIANNTAAVMFSYVFVVICLKTRTFAVSQTTGVDIHVRHLALWFAWKLVLLQYRKQLYTRLSSK